MLKTNCLLLLCLFLFFIQGCSNDNSARLSAENERLKMDVKLGEDRVKSLEEQIKKLRDDNLVLSEELNNLKRRLIDIGISENPDEASFEVCKENLKKIALGLRLYAADNNKKYPKKLSSISPNPKYLDYIPTCPAVKKDTYTDGYKVSSDKKSYVIRCLGHNHGTLRIKQNNPMFDSKMGLKVERDETPPKEED